MGLEHYKVKSLKSVVERDLPNLQKTIRLRIQKAIKERLTVDPINLGEPLHHSLKGRRRLRVGEYRIIYRVNQLEQIVTIVFSKMNDKFPLWYYQPKVVSLYIYTLEV